MNTEEIRRKMKELCICRQCPSFIDCREYIAFCLAESGKSQCIKIEKGCICGGCPVEKQMGFMHGYYCMRGPEKTSLNN